MADAQYEQFREQSAGHAAIENYTYCDTSVSGPSERPSSNSRDYAGTTTAAKATHIRASANYVRSLEGVVRIASVVSW